MIFSNVSSIHERYHRSMNHHSEVFSNSPVSANSLSLSLSSLFYFFSVLSSKTICFSLFPLQVFAFKIFRFFCVLLFIFQIQSFNYRSFAPTVPSGKTPFISSFFIFTTSGIFHSLITISTASSSIAGSINVAFTTRTRVTKKTKPLSLSHSTIALIKAFHIARSYVRSHFLWAHFLCCLYI